MLWNPIEPFANMQMLDSFWYRYSFHTLFVNVFEALQKSRNAMGHRSMAFSKATFATNDCVPYVYGSGLVIPRQFLELKSFHSRMG